MLTCAVQHEGGRRIPGDSVAESGQLLQAFLVGNSPGSDCLSSGQSADPVARPIRGEPAGANLGNTPKVALAKGAAYRNASPA